MLFKKVELTEEMEDGVRVAKIGQGHIRVSELDDSSSFTDADGVAYAEHGEEVIVDICTNGVSGKGIYGLWEGSNGKNLILAEW